MNRTGSALIIILLAVMIVLVVGGIWYYKVHKPPTTVSQGETSTATTTVTVQTSTSAVSFATITQIKLSPQFQNKIAFIKNSEIWLANSDGSDPAQLTHTNGMVYDYDVSVDRAYLAYTVRINSEKARVNVIDLATGNTIRTFTNYWKDAFLGSEMSMSWFPEDRLYLSNDNSPVLESITTSSSVPFSYSDDGAELAFYGVAVVSSTPGSWRPDVYTILQVENPIILYSHHIFPQGSNDFVELHSYDTTTHEDKLIGTFVNVESALLSNDGSQLAISAQASTSPYGYSTYIYPSTILSQSTSTLGSVEAWSPDDRFIMVGSYIINVADPSNQKTFVAPTDIYTWDDVGPSPPDPQTGLQWTRDDNLIFETGPYGGTLDLYNTQTQTTTLFSASSSNAFVL